jgi:hypothetical protein
MRCPGLRGRVCQNIGRPRPTLSVSGLAPSLRKYPYLRSAEPAKPTHPPARAAGGRTQRGRPVFEHVLGISGLSGDHAFRPAQAGWFRSGIAAPGAAIDLSPDRS